MAHRTDAGGVSSGVGRYVRPSPASNRARLSERPVTNLRVRYHRLPAALEWLRQDSRRIGINFYYYLWQIGAASVARRIATEVDFDFVLHSTYVRYWQPSFFVLLSVPFIWGPVGGGESAPRGMWRGLGIRGQLFEAARAAARWCGEHDPFVRLTARRSMLCFATTAATANRLRRLGGRVVEIASVVSPWGRRCAHAWRSTASPLGPVRFVSIGRLVRWKGFHLGIAAFTRADLPGAEYYILGEGPDRKRLEGLIKQLGLSDRVKLLGPQPRESVLQQLGVAHVLVHPSLHDSGGWVCIEAMAAGRPVLCLDTGGPGEQVTAEVGIKIRPGDQGETVEELAQAMRRLAGDQELRARLGAAGKVRVQQRFTWETKIGCLLDRFNAEVARAYPPSA